MQYDNLYVLIEVFSPFTYKIISDTLRFKCNTLLFDFYVFHLFCCFSFVCSLGFIEYFIYYFIPFVQIILVYTLFHYYFIGYPKDDTCFLDSLTSNINWCFYHFSDNLRTLELFFSIYTLSD